MNKIPTNQGNKTISEILDHLNFSSYIVQRDGGCSHEMCIKHGIGNDAMKAAYEAMKSVAQVVEYGTE